MKEILRRYAQEINFYAACWFLVLAVPLFREAYLYSVGALDEFEWVEVGYDYLAYIPFIVCFLLSKLFFEPRIYFRGHPRRFFAVAILTSLVVSSVYVYITPSPRHRRLYRMMREQHHTEWVQPPTKPTFEHKPSFSRSLVRGPFLPTFLFSLLMMGACLNPAILYRQRRQEQQLREEKAAHLQSELDYLTYQINPHFFMNTLNNIHALVDIDSQAAKESIIELSKLMRYLLYESNHPTVPLGKEVSFLQHYLELMRIRCDESVSISFSQPDDVSQLQRYEVPPLLLISFVENAFKHGISHQHPSFIEISLQLESEHIHFRCRNSNYSSESATLQQGGIGLDNLRKRLSLIYPDRYRLQIEPTEREFRVDLLLPLT